MALFDAHLHFGDPARLDELLRYLRAGSLSGAALLSLPDPGWINFNPEILYAKALHPRLFRGFGSFHLDFRGGPAPPLEEQVRSLAAAGFDGLKVWAGKPSVQRRLGLAPDGPAFSAAFTAAGEAEMPVILHAADPRLFWDGEQAAAEGWLPFSAYIDQAGRAAAEHRSTRFVFPHLLFLADDLSALAAFLEAHPNTFLDTAPGNYFYAPLARRREETAELFHRYAGRILLGSDGLLFPPAYTALDYMDEQTVRSRFTRLRDFFLRGATVDNPFPPTAEQTPEVTGPALSEEAAYGLREGAFRRLFPAGTPRRLSPEGVRRYLDGFPRSVPFREELIERIAGR